MAFHTQIASSKQVAGDVHSVCETQTPNVNPSGGLRRLIASGVDLSEEQVAAIRCSQAADIDPNIPITYAWPTAVEVLRGGGLHITGITKCSLCRRLHFTGLSADPLRVPECSDGFPPFHGGRRKPGLVRVVPILDVLPDEIVFEMKAPTADLATFCKIALETVEREPAAYASLAADVSELRSLAVYRRTTRWRRSHSEAAFAALVRSRVLEERICIIAEGSDLPEPQRTYSARRQALAQFIRGYGPGKMRNRVARALYAALKAAGRGEL
ncbi:hypothetical protein EOC93_02290 [Mesorhizobium sp. M6A.T.Ce.TU.002.03.1.1]|uniref:hypothetical protein n=1 Tax=Mesorhizobium sp. M6A.T.Ce.TU.002.03.1.1 TaxID=2496782 RepID=UPI000FCAA53B|nr:hypothetical protein [Mesorhizobium sp. M6A.T.Ce.TU.002.03.1.1]RUU46622.1 hypothetical protein EOC93_02290 [Mesorhizobium sp. M6A.T.Ce.TU.002.03.1.1]